MSEYAMPTIGDVIAGKYRLEKVAGEGGMGIVYAAEHLLLKQRVAVKVLLPDAARSEAVVERFAREAQTAARINSEHVARVFDAGSLPSGAPFLVMEYLEGCDLEELLELQNKLPVHEVVDYAIQACEALAHAHAIGVVHRDLKPANLYLACRPEGGNAIKVIDFGISKRLKAGHNEKKLTGHHVLGSPVYMSPEQLRNAKEIDGRADLWSLGVVVYEMLTATTPFDADGVGEIFAAILANDPVPLAERNTNVPPGLSDVVTKCLKRDAAERWQDAGELARALIPYG
jgi:serine/threonine-protein kinase